MLFVEMNSYRLFLDILESEVLPEVLQIILTIGNFLNGVSYLVGNKKISLHY